MRVVVAFALLAALPAIADAQAPDPADHASINQNWKPDELMAAVEHECEVPVGFWSAEKQPDGTAVIQASPSLTPNQQACIDELVAQSQLTLAQ